MRHGTRIGISLVIIFLIGVELFGARSNFMDRYTTFVLTKSPTTTPSIMTQIKEPSAFQTAANEVYNRTFVGTGALEASSKIVRRNFSLGDWTQRAEGGLHDADRVLVAKIYSKASSLFEFGLGESTYIANHVGVPRYAGVDSDPVWIAKTRDAVDGRFRFYLADIGMTRNWGYPKDDKLIKSELDYQILPLYSEPLAFDVYMVDGRWRLPCLLVSFLHASDRGANVNETTVLMHDCFRPTYHKADHLLDLVERKDRLCVYKRMASTTDAQILELWREIHGEVA